MYNFRLLPDPQYEKSKKYIKSLPDSISQKFDHWHCIISIPTNYRRYKWIKTINDFELL